MLKSVSIGWHWLERTLNGIIDQVNAQHIIPSASIAVQEAANGTMLTVTKIGGAASDTSGGSGGANDPKGYWTTVTIVNPATCAQSQIQVWAKPV
jgi:hypothetical protein